MAGTTFLVIEILTMLKILNAYPTSNRRDMQMVDGLARALELTDDEREAIKWVDEPIDDTLDQRQLTWLPGATLERTLTKRQQRRIVVYVENPPPGQEWTRARLGLYNSIVGKLGGTPIGDDDDLE